MSARTPQRGDADASKVGGCFNTVSLKIPARFFVDLGKILKFI